MNKIKQIKEHLSKITGHTWFYEEDELTWDLYADAGYPMPLKILKAPKKSKEYAEWYPEQVDAEFIANSPEYVRELLEEIDALNALVEFQDALSDNDDKLYKELLEENKKLTMALQEIVSIPKCTCGDRKQGFNCMCGSYNAHEIAEEALKSLDKEEQ